MQIVTMPQLGETVTEGTITRWLKDIGEHVGADEALFEVSTDKVDTEVPVLAGGWLRELLVAEGATAPIGAPLAVLTATADEPYDAGVARSPGSPPVPGGPAKAGVSPAPTPAPEPRASEPGTDASPRTPPRAAPAAATGSMPSLSPVVRRLLAEHRLDPAQVAGSGRDGRITRADVLAAVAQATRRPVVPPGAVPGAVPTASPIASPIARGPDDDVVEFTRARRATAEHMVRSLHTSAHTLVATQVDYQAVEAARSTAGTARSYLPFVARAVVDALRAFPHLNASVGDDELIVHRRIHLGVAVDVDHEALVVPVVHDADLLRLGPLAEAITALAARARARRLGTDDLAGGTFTITNVGRYGTAITAPVINQPQVAILSTDGVRRTPAAVATDDGGWAVAIHPIGNLSLSFDHRAVDGAYAAAFLALVRDTLEQRDWASEVGS